MKSYKVFKNYLIFASIALCSIGGICIAISTQKDVDTLLSVCIFVPLLVVSFLIVLFKIVK